MKFTLYTADCTGNAKNTVYPNQKVITSEADLKKAVAFDHVCALYDNFSRSDAKEKVSAIMRAFLERVEAAGYFVGLYGSASSLVTHTADDIKSRYTIWLAHWIDQTNYSGAYGIWQHSEKGKVAGISGNVDLDIGYKDFPTIIREKGLNGYGKEEVLPNPPVSAADDGITVEVTVDGKKYSGKLNKE